MLHSHSLTPAWTSPLQFAARQKSPARTAPREVVKPAAVTREYTRIALLAILALAAFLRFYQLPTVPRGIQIDEAMNGANILEIQETGDYHVFYPENMGREGLFINLQAIASSVLGNEPWVLRSVSATFGVATVWSTYLIATELFTPWIGLAAAFFMASSFWHLILSRMGTRAICAPFFLTLTLYLLISSLRRVRKGESAIGRMILAGVVCGLGFHTYTAYRVSPAIYGLVLLYYFLDARRNGWLPLFLKECGAFAVVVIIVVTPLALYLIQHPAAAAGRASQVLVFNRSANPALEILLNTWRTAQMFFFEGDRGGRHNYAGQREVYWPVAILLAIGIGLAVIAVIRAGRSLRGEAAAYALLLGWLAVGGIPAILSGEGVPHALRSNLMIPAAFMLAAAGAAWVWSRMETLPQAASLGIAGVFVLLVIWDPYHTYFDLWIHHPDTPEHYSIRLVELAERYNAMPRTAPKYIGVMATGPSANGIPVLLMPFTYITRSYTRKEQDETNIRYITPQNFRIPPGINPAGKTFCQVVQESLPGAILTCMNLRY